MGGRGEGEARGPVGPDGTRRAGDARVRSWREWFPGLDNDDRSLRAVLAELPATPPSAIPWVVRLFENPRGWLRLHGAVDLAHHDMIHVLLGRGLLDQDEAFVIGYTMGSTKKVSWVERLVFKVVVAAVYPKPYRMPWRTLAAYDLGLEAGRRSSVTNLHLAVGEQWLDRPLGETRRALGIDTAFLRGCYAREREMLPETLASQRLPQPLGDQPPRPSGPPLTRMPTALRHPAFACQHTPALGTWAAPHGFRGAAGLSAGLGEG